MKASYIAAKLYCHCKLIGMARLCGFNLGNWYSQSDFTPESSKYYLERDFKFVSDLGFNFIRLPVDYNFLEVEPYEYDNARLCMLDRAINWASKYGLYLLLDIHRLPGYAIGRQDYSLWTDQEKINRSKNLWRYLARRYKDYGSELAFDIINEPSGVDDAALTKFYEEMIDTIREEDPDRVVFVEGNERNRVYASVPLPVHRKDVVQSFHQYEPLWVTHLGASWAGLAYNLGLSGERPDYPGMPNLEELYKQYPNDPFMKYRGVYVDKKWLENTMRPYLDLKQAGEEVHCSEFGVLAKMAKRSTAINWYRDLLAILKEHDIGWALWNLRGGFGILSTGRDEWLTGRSPWGEPMDEGLLRVLIDAL